MFSLCRKSLTKNNYFQFCTSYHDKQTIYALSSGVNTAVSVILVLLKIVRVSGPSAYKVLKLLQPKKTEVMMTRNEYFEKFKLKPKVMSLRHIYGEDHGLIDKCLVVYFG